MLFFKPNPRTIHVDESPCTLALCGIILGSTLFAVVMACYCFHRCRAERAQLQEQVANNDRVAGLV